MGCRSVKECQGAGRDRGSKAPKPLTGDDLFCPCRPSEEQAMNYVGGIIEIRRQAVQTGVMSPRPGGAEPSAQRGANDAVGSSRRFGRRSNQSSIHASDKTWRQPEGPTAYPLGDLPPVVRRATVFQCKPLAEEYVLAKGRHSRLLLSVMTVSVEPWKGWPAVRQQTSMTSLSPAQVPPAPPANSSNGWEAHQGALHAPPDGLMDRETMGGSPHRPCASHSCTSPSTGFGSCSPSRRYLIAMKECTLTGAQQTLPVLEQIKCAVRWWSRLSAYCPRLVRCLQLEYVDVDNTCHPASNSGFHDYDIEELGRGNCSREKRSLLQSLRITPAQSLSTPKRSSPPQKARIYLEYAPYGSARSLQLHTTPKLYNRTHLHELTARAIMYEVLLALAYLHENEMLQFDLNASMILLTRPVSAVYGTDFPQYIADLPRAQHSHVPSKLRSIVHQLDPCAEEPLASPIRDHKRSHGASREQYAFSSPLRGLSCDLEVAGYAPRSGATSVDVGHSLSRGSFTTGAHGFTATTKSVEFGMGLAEGRSPTVGPLRHGGVLVGRDMCLISRNDSAASLDDAQMDLILNYSKSGCISSPVGELASWQRGLVLPQQLEELVAGEDDESLPLPSPHDGYRGPREAALLMADEPNCPPFDRTDALPLGGLGGVTIYCPHRYGEAADSTGYGTSSLKPALPLLLQPNADEKRGHDIRMAHRRQRPPLIKLNHSALLRQALCGGQVNLHWGTDPMVVRDVPVHRFCAVTHAAPEVLEFQQFSSASDVYAFAMTFLELVTPSGELLSSCRPKGKATPQTLREMDAYNAEFAENIRGCLMSRTETLKHQPQPASIAAEYPPIAVPLPSYLSDEFKRMLRLCLQADPTKRPTVVDLLQCKYFLLGNWITSSKTDPSLQAPEPPWVVGSPSHTMLVAVE